MFITCSYAHKNAKRHLIAFNYCKVADFLCDHLVFLHIQKSAYGKDHIKINKWEILLSWWRQSDANVVNNKSVWFIHQQFLDAFGKAFIVDATTVS